MKTYSNLVDVLVVDDWPISSSLKGKAEFTIEKNKKGERVCRITEDKWGKPCKPKYGTYGKRVRIATGSDGKTYIVSITEYNQLHVMQGNLKYSEEYITEDDERYKDLFDRMFNC